MGGKGTAGTRWTPKKREEFLEHLAETGNVTASAKEAGGSRQGAYDIRAEDEKFAAAWDAAVEESVDSLEAEARRRAFEGVQTPLHHQGKRTGDNVTKYSDTLLMFLLNGNRPDKFKHRSDVTHTGVATGKVTLVMPDNGRGPKE